VSTRADQISAALLAACDSAIRDGKPLPPLKALAAQCGAPSNAALTHAVITLARAGDLVRILTNGPCVYRLRDGRCTPAGQRLEIAK
jgi:hypothetical protein